MDLELVATALLAYLVWALILSAIVSWWLWRD